MYVIKRDGRQEKVHFDKITSRITRLCYGLNELVDPVIVSQKVMHMRCTVAHAHALLHSNNTLHSSLSFRACLIDLNLCVHLCTRYVWVCTAV